MVRVERAAVVAGLTRRLGSLDLAEDAFQEAAVRALERWPDLGVPQNPGAWLTTAARNAALDRLRREARRIPKEEAAMDLMGDDDRPDPGAVRDDLLRLLFTCCHPALAPEARVALALRTIAGLTTSEIAAAFLVPEPTMGQRISRAKRKIADAAIPYRVPADHELPDRLPAVLAVVYVTFTEAHHSSSAAGPVRVDLAEEAIRLGRLLVELMPDVTECHGLLALMLATHARRDARTRDDGAIVLLGEQDRSRWDREAIAEADAILDAALRRRDVGPYQVQAAIACLHGTATSDADTDWCQIERLYSVLVRLRPSPVVSVNRAVAVARCRGADAGLAALDEIEGAERWHLFHAARGALLVDAARIDEATAAFEAALGCSPPAIDRRFLEGRLHTIGSGT